MVKNEIHDAENPAQEEEEVPKNPIIEVDKNSVYQAKEINKDHPSSN